MPSFAPSPFAAFSEAFQAHVDGRMEMSNMEREPRDYLGGSRLGEECVRMLGYEFNNVTKDEGRDFKGRTYRLFDFGHDGEARMAAYLRTAGFLLLTERPDGAQFGFGVAPHPKTGRNRIAGHIDGVITFIPPDFEPRDDFHGGKVYPQMAVPALWENKSLNNKGWQKCLKEGVKRAKPVYHSQMQTYMAYLGLAENAGLFTALNRDTGEIYAELVPFDSSVAQAATDRGVKVIAAESPDELPRIAAERTDFRCKFCSYQDRCWAVPEVASGPVTAPAWFTNGKA